MPRAEEFDHEAEEKARVELFLDPAYRVRVDRGAAARLARSRSFSRQRASDVRTRLEFLRMQGWQTQGLPVHLLDRSLESLVARTLFVDKHRCGGG
jgi:hypothetical protein